MLEKYAEMFKQLQAEKEQNTHTDINDKVLLIDGLNLYIRVHQNVPVLTDDGIHIGGISGFLLSLGSVIRQFKPTRCIIVFDGKGGNSRRKKLYPGYKAGRTFKINPNRLETFGHTEDQELESMKLQLQRLMQYFQSLPLTVISQDQVEADDVISYIAGKLCKKEVIISSTDKDFLHLVDERTKVWSPVKKKLYDVDLVKSEWGVHPNNLVLARAFEGDSSDNIPGVKGVGLKTLIKRIPIVTEEVSIDPDAIFDFCTTQLNEGSKLKLFTNIVENKDIVNLNMRLMDLKLLEFSATTKSAVRQQYESTPPKLNFWTFKEQYSLDKLYAGIPNLKSWLQHTFNHLTTFVK